MDAIPIFLNDLSYPLAGDDGEVRSEIIQLLRTLRAIRALNRPFVVGGLLKLSDIQITYAYATLASYANVVGREWWRFIRGLDQRTPFQSMPQCVAPDSAMHIVARWQGGTAPLWAKKNAAFLLSFPSCDDWRAVSASFSVCSCSDGEHAPAQLDCKNLSSPNHVESWSNELLDFDYVQAASSTIYESYSFRLKMYLHDHEPPHVHVYQRANLRKCVGRIRIDQVEVMDDDGLSSSVRKEALELLLAKQTQVLRGWERCRGGNLPHRID